MNPFCKAILLVVLVAGCGGVVDRDGPELDASTPLPDCPELLTPDECAGRGPGWVHEVPACDEFGGYLIYGCEWHDDQCVRGPYA